MSILLYCLHTAAFLAQIAGAVLVINEARQTLTNIQVLKSGLDVAETEKDKHQQALKSQRPQSIPGFNGGTIQLPVINPDAHEGLVQQVGPGAAAERKALRDFLEMQFPGNGRLTWVGVGLLLAGITVGYVANMLAIAG